MVFDVFSWFSHPFRMCFPCFSHVGWDVPMFFHVVPRISHVFPCFPTFFPCPTFWCFFPHPLGPRGGFTRSAWRQPSTPWSFPWQRSWASTSRCDARGATVGCGRSVNVYLVPINQSINQYSWYSSSIDEWTTVTTVTTVTDIVFVWMYLFNESFF